MNTDTPTPRPTPTHQRFSLSTGASTMPPKPIAQPPLTTEKMRQKAIEALSDMCLDDDDMAIVAVASPYRRLDNISLILDGTEGYLAHENMTRLADAIRGTEVERFINAYFVGPAVEETIERCEMLNGESKSKATKEAYERGRSDEFNRIVKLLKGGAQ